ncbi:DUF2158 domain-containing protein [Dyadobacter psychrotolerans]|uniref:DUF2158 domain-containing protein n=1 Tax=Dyadobacter psychrotolerans TaxID=2541721 RepID=A0A4R5DN01_9BACT|nr:DUF2158 domain-containing protein [Dyadobacter psychrotolerans]TDE15549.1 DUF2158 domain-containing protein [Dyadobacter psychrotolerans]
MADDAKFKIGDTIRLKSGGPLMTVSEVYKSDPAFGEAIWFTTSEATGVCKMSVIFKTVDLITAS